MSSSYQLPIDIIIDILIRLPAKPLMRFKCVSRAWYHLINAPDFAQLHLDRSISTHSNLHFVFGKPALHMADFDTFDNPIELGYPFKYMGAGYAFMIGYSNGLLCLWNGDCYNYTVAVYNPTTRTHRILPRSPTPSTCPSLQPNWVLGFGHDAALNDFKFVRICQFSDVTTNFSYSEVMVYSLRNDTWIKVLDHIPHDFSACRSREGLFLKGSFHWVIASERDHPPNPIVGFNVTTNTFFELSVPHVFLNLYYCDMFVGELDGCLCVVLNYVGFIEIWIMKEYGVVESWTRLYMINRGGELFSMEKPVGFTLDRKALYLRIGLRITTLDLETLKMQNVDVFGDPSRLLGAYICVENLFMLDCLSEDPMTKQQEDEGTSKRRRTLNGKKNRRMRN